MQSMNLLVQVSSVCRGQIPAKGKKLSTEEKEALFEELYDDVVTEFNYDLYDDAKAAFEVDCPVSVRDTEHFVVGANAPKKLIGIAKRWNNDLKNEFRAALKAMFGGKTSIGADFKVDTNETYEVSKLARAIDNSVFEPFAPAGVYAGNQFTNIISDSVLADVVANPEDYAIITLFVDSF